MQKGDLVRLKIEKYAFEGKGITRMESTNADQNVSSDGFIVFVKGAYPGDDVSARINKLKKSYAEAVAETIHTPSPYRIQPRCKYFGACGGCKQQDLNYEQQIIYKQQQVEDIFLHSGRLSGFITEDILPSEKTYYYRNKMEFSFSDLKWLTEDDLAGGGKSNRVFVLGLHVPKIFDKILDIEECFLQSELSSSIVNFTREFFKGRKTTIYNTKDHTGYLRNLVIRQSVHTNDLLVNLVTSEPNESLMKEYAAAITDRFPAVTTLVNNINQKKAAVALGDYEIVYHGSGFIYDKIGEYNFRISANSFFQTNALQAEKLYNTALEYADLKGNEIVYDLYSGAGTIAIFVSKYAKEAYGFESFEAAVFDARENLEINDIHNVRFFHSDLNKSFLPVILPTDIPGPDVVILDPPRSGMHKHTVSDLLKLKPAKIVYVSCDPGTQVRDIRLLVDEGYKLIKIRPVDMFPHTYHIENVALLTR